MVNINRDSFLMNQLYAHVAMPYSKHVIISYIIMSAINSYETSSKSLSKISLSFLSSICF